MKPHVHDPSAPNVHTAPGTFEITPHAVSWSDRLTDADKAFYPQLSRYLWDRGRDPFEVDGLAGYAGRSLSFVYLSLQRMLAAGVIGAEIEERGATSKPRYRSVWLATRDDREYRARASAEVDKERAKPRRKSSPKPDAPFHPGGNKPDAPFHPGGKGFHAGGDNPVDARMQTEMLPISSKRSIPDNQTLTCAHATENPGTPEVVTGCLEPPPPAPPPGPSPAEIARAKAESEVPLFREWLAGGNPYMAKIARKRLAEIEAGDFRVWVETPPRRPAPPPPDLAVTPAMASWPASIGPPSPPPPPASAHVETIDLWRRVASAGEAGDERATAKAVDAVVAQTIARFDDPGSEGNYRRLAADFVAGMVPFKAIFDALKFANSGNAIHKGKAFTSVISKWKLANPGWDRPRPDIRSQEVRRRC